MLDRVVGARNKRTASRAWLICLNNACSNVGGNVAVRNTSCVCAWISLLSCRMVGWKSADLGNITWHSSIMIRSSRCTIRSWFKNEWNLGVMADLGVMSTIDALSGGRRRSYTAYEMLSCWHRRWKSWRSVISGITTTVVPLGLMYAGNINSMLFPLLVGMTAMMGLLLCWMACSAGPWTPCSLSLAYWVICCAACVRFACCSWWCRQICCLATASSHGACLRLLSTDGGSNWADVNPKKWC